MSKNKRNKILEDVLLTSIDISHPGPIYNARGRVTGYGVTMRYYVAKMFGYSSDNRKDELDKAEKDLALDWVCQMQETGYQLIRSPKFHDAPQSRSFNIYMICDYMHRFNEFPFFNAGKRAWRFWLEKQNEVAVIKKQHSVMQKIHENTK